MIREEMYINFRFLKDLKLDFNFMFFVDCLEVYFCLFLILINIVIFVFSNLEFYRLR